MKQFIKHHFKSFYRFLFNQKLSIISLIGKYNRLLVIKYWYKALHHREINLENPVDFDEKINWLKLYSDTSKWTMCADKYEVRSFISSLGLGHTLNDIYGVFDNAKEIDFSNLPDSFVIKTTNGGGGKTVLVVKDKSKLNIKKTIKTLNKWLKQKASSLYGEYHYAGIKPRLLVEKYLQPEPGEESITDIKLNCFNGEPYSVFFCSDRQFGEKVCYSVYDLDWNLQLDKITEDHRTEKIYPRPQSFDLMLEYSYILAKEFPFVRVDWYEIDGKPVFSELTFTPGAGFQTFYSEEYQIELGNQLKLPSRTKAL